jgi:hypothetical protein
VGAQGSVLGTIRWWGAWRQYVFFPGAGCLFSAGCLEDINAQIRELMFMRRQNPPDLIEGQSER